MSEEDKVKEIERFKEFFKKEYPKAKIEQMDVITLYRENPMEIVIIGPDAKDYRTVLKNCSGMLKSFLNKSFVKKYLGPSGEQLVIDQNASIRDDEQQLAEALRELNIEREDARIKKKDLEDSDHIY